jgi:endonuclease YncB( thermonuclease family)
MKKLIYLMLLLCSLSAQAQVYNSGALVSRIPSIDNPRFYTKHGDTLPATLGLYASDQSTERQTRFTILRSGNKDTVIEITEKLGYVFAVHDGDSYTMQFAEKSKARIAFIDFPEIAWPRIPATQAYGRALGDSVRNLIKGKVLKYKIIGVDQYGRYVVDCKLDKTDLQLLFLQKGWCWLIPEKDDSNTRKLSKTRRLKYAAAERKARKNKLGLWAGYTNSEGQFVEPIAPWEFRKQNALPSN